MDGKKLTRKPAVPRQTEIASQKTKKMQKDFVSENIVNAILTEPKRPVEEKVVWSKRPGFGRAPAYLERVKAEIAAEREYVLNLLSSVQAREAESQGMGAGNVHELSEEERHELLHALKLKWDEVSSTLARILTCQ